MRPRFQIGFDFNSASSGMRELLAGVRDSRHSGQWDLHDLVQSGLTPMLHAHRKELDGLFAFVGGPDHAPAAERAQGVGQAGGREGGLCGRAAEH